MITKEVDKFGDTIFYNELNQIHQDIDEPAVIFKSGTVEYYKNDKIHRLSSPAWIFPDGSCFYCIHGKLLPKEKFDRHPLVREYRLKKVVEDLLSG